MFRKKFTIINKLALLFIFTTCNFQTGTNNDENRSTIILDKLNNIKPNITNHDTELGKRMAKLILNFRHDKRNVNTYPDPFRNLGKVSISKQKVRLINKIIEKVDDQALEKAYSNLNTIRASLSVEDRNQFWNKKIDKNLFDNLTINIKKGGFELENYDKKTKGPYIVCNFANRLVGGGICKFAMTQEEQLIIMGAGTPAVSEIDASKKGTSHLMPNEALLFKNFPIFGILNTDLIYPVTKDWEFILQDLIDKNGVKPLNKPVLIDMLAIDAPKKSRERINIYSQQEIDHIVNKLILSMIMLKNEYKDEKEITFVFGNFGCGAFNNSPKVIFTLFLIILAVINKYYAGPKIKIDMHPLSSENIFKNVYNTLNNDLINIEKSISIKEYWSIIKQKLDIKVND